MSKPWSAVATGLIVLVAFGIGLWQARRRRGQ
jgi:hypothetical protein